MIWLASVLLAQAAATPAPEVENEILVIAQRLNAVHVSVGQDAKGRWHCGMDGSSGVRSLDERLCKAVTGCVKKGNRADAEVKQCVAGEKSALLAKFRRETIRSHR